MSNYLSLWFLLTSIATCFFSEHYSIEVALPLAAINIFCIHALYKFWKMFSVELPNYAFNLSLMIQENVK